MSKATFEGLMATIAGKIAEKPVDGSLVVFLNETFPADGDVFTGVEALCASGEAEGGPLGPGCFCRFAPRRWDSAHVAIVG